MVDSDSTDGLPPGWSQQGRKNKYYVNSTTGQKFYSKDDLMRYVKTQNHQGDQPQATESTIERPLNNNQIQLVQHTNDHPKWLPQDWTMELKTTKYGKAYKTFVDPSSGYKFYSKPQVLRHIKNELEKASIFKPKEITLSNTPTTKQPIENTNQQPEWLPHGWTVELKTSQRRSGRTYKCYVDPSGGHKFFSKTQVFQFLRKSSTSKQKEMQMSIVPKSRELTENTIECPEWLPSGWKVELKTSQRRSGRTYKCYVDPSTGQKFFSKPQVFRFIGSAEQKSVTSAIVPKSRVKSESTVEGLPPGWIKKVIARKYDKRIKDPFYIDPETGYVFRSKRDVHRYLETGDMTKCAILPKKMVIEENTPPSSAAKRQKLEHPVTRNQLIIGGELTDRKQEQNLDCKIENEEKSSLGKSKHQKWLDLPRRCSKRLAGETLDVDSIAQSSSEVVRKQRENAEIGTKADGSCEVKIQNTKSKRTLNLPLQSSKRLAGVKFDSLVNSMSVVQALPSTVRPPDDGISQAVDLNNGALTVPEPVKEFQLHNSSDNNITLVGDPLNESQIEIINADSLPVLAPEANKKQANKSLESEKKQRSQVQDEINLIASWIKKDPNLARGSSKRLSCTANSVAEVVVAKTSISVSGIDAPSHDKTHREDESPNDPSQARGKLIRFNAEQLKILEREFELNNHPKPERRMELARDLGVQPNRIQNWFQNRKVKLKKEQIQKEHVHLQKKIVAAQADNQNIHAKTPSHLHEEKPNRPFVDVPAGPKDKLPPVEVSKNNDKKSDAESIQPLGQFLSDPCLEFAFKTLTSDLPVEDPVSTPAADVLGERDLTAKTMGPKVVATDWPEQRPFVSFADWAHPSFDSGFTQVKSYFEQQVEPAQIQPLISPAPRDISSTLPDLGLPSVFQTDISVHFGSPEKLHLPPSKPPLPSQPVQPVVKKNRGRPRKVNP